MLDHGNVDAHGSSAVEQLRHRMRHSAAHVMADAVLRLLPEAKMGIGPPTQDGFYNDFGGGNNQINGGVAEGGALSQYDTEDIEFDEELGVFFIFLLSP